MHEASHQKYKNDQLSDFHFMLTARVLHLTRVLLVSKHRAKTYLGPQRSGGINFTSSTRKSLESEVIRLSIVKFAQIRLNSAGSGQNYGDAQSSTVLCYIYFCVFLLRPVNGYFVVN